MKYVSPSVRETAFNCPHCSALAKQSWYTAHAEGQKKDFLPNIIDEGFLAKIEKSHEMDEEFREKLLAWGRRAVKRKPFLERNSHYRDFDISNVWFSQCFNCDELSVWIYDQLSFPRMGSAPPANTDLPSDIRRDYDEASEILDASPRGAAALIRLGIQKLCKELGMPGNNINDDISALVSVGLDPRVQKALDAVRVIGNNAVHPGKIDLRDDRATAESLFRLLNLVTEKMISEAKHVEAIYAGLPESARKAIERRDAENGGGE